MIEEKNFRFEYMMLERLKVDCEYWLGWGDKNDNQLWAKNPEKQIAEMRRIYSILPKKPKWLTIKQINRLSRRMIFNNI